MAKTPDKLAKSKAGAKTSKAPATKPRAKAPQQGADAAVGELTEKQEQNVLKALDLCVGHLNTLGSPTLALETIRRLKDYYLAHGRMPVPKNARFF